MGEAQSFPLEDIENVYTYKMPEYTDPARYKSIETAVREKSDKYIMGMFPHFMFLHMLDLFGFVNFMMQLLDNPEKVEFIAEKLT